MERQAGLFTLSDLLDKLFRCMAILLTFKNLLQPLLFPHGRANAINAFERALSIALVLVKKQFSSFSLGWFNEAIVNEFKAAKVLVFTDSTSS